MPSLSPFARFAVGFSFLLFLALLIGIALFGGALSQDSFLGLTWGQLLIVAIHTIPVGFAWYYVWVRSSEE